MVSAALIITVVCVAGIKIQDTASRTEASEISDSTANLPLGESNSLWVVVNKQRPLRDRAYMPQVLKTPAIAFRQGMPENEMLLRDDAAEALRRMAFAAESNGVPLLLSSGYRSFENQEATLAETATRKGVDAALLEVARGGHSEHQTGLAADLGSTDANCLGVPCFADTPTGKWLAENAYLYGFILRYPDNKQDITGYGFEPWHFRYVGMELAARMKDRHVLTMEEYFHLPPASAY